MIETTRKPLRDANKRINDINRKTLIHDNNRTPSAKKNVVVIRDSMTKYLRLEDLSSQDKNIKIVTHLGSMTCWII